MARWKAGARGRHQTVHRDARQALAWLDGQPGVRKVVLGRYSPHRPRATTPGTLAVRAACGVGVTFAAYTGEGVLELTALVDAAADRSRLAARAADRWPGATHAPAV